MYAFGVGLKYANLSNIMLGISNSFFENTNSSFENTNSSFENTNSMPQGPVVQKWVNLILGLKGKIRSKLPNSLFKNLEIFFHKSYLGHQKFNFITF